MYGDVPPLALAVNDVVPPYAEITPELTDATTMLGCATTTDAVSFKPFASVTM